MKQQQRELTTLVFDYMNGLPIFSELHAFTERRGFRRDSGQNISTVEFHVVVGACCYELSDSCNSTARCFELRTCNDALYERRLKHLIHVNSQHYI
jgi:hypothetical protein